MSAVTPFGGITTAQLGANLSALSCPTGHANVVPVELLLTGERVAALCTDCNRQLPAEWAPLTTGDLDARQPGTAEELMRRDEAEHNADHHGHPGVQRLACRLCGEEMGY